MFPITTWLISREHRPNFNDGPWHRMPDCLGWPVSLPAGGAVLQALSGERNDAKWNSWLQLLAAAEFDYPNYIAGPGILHRVLCSWCENLGWNYDDQRRTDILTIRYARGFDDTVAMFEDFSARLYPMLRRKAREEDVREPVERRVHIILLLTAYALEKQWYRLHFGGPDRGSVLDRTILTVLQEDQRVTSPTGWYFT